MNKPQRGLGRGLDALFRGQLENERGNPVQMLLVSEVRPNPEQPRSFFSDDSLAELAESIRTQGVLQPILVRPVPEEGAARFEIVAGERRWRASQLAGQRTIPALVREMSLEQALAIALIENLQREDLTPMEEARGFRELKEKFGLSQEEIAGRVGKSRSAVANMLRLLNLPVEVQEDLQTGRMTQGHARPLLAIDDPEAALSFRSYVLEQMPSVREVEAKVARWKNNGELPHSGAVSAAPVARKPKVAGDNDYARLGEELSAYLKLPVRVKVRAGKGNIRIEFESEEELTALLQRWGFNQSVNHGQQ